ncbi:MAG: secreted hydrolase [Mycobacterium sp.]
MSPTPRQVAVTNTIPSRPEAEGPDTADWERYPFDLVPGDDELAFPASEGAHPQYEADTWYLSGQLTAPTTDRNFAFLGIFNMNRPGGSVVADFYTMALFDLDRGVYGTYTDYDMPPQSMKPGAIPKLTSAAGHLDMTYDSGAGRVEWIAQRDAAGQLIPYTYDVVLVGTDQNGIAMELRLNVEPTRAPVPVGADVYNGRIPHGGQAETFSYFQTGMTMSGNLKWGDVDAEVAGSAGHIDRQWFPLPPGAAAADGDYRTSSHEWWTIHLDNGVDFIGWQQFDRRKHNALHPFSGATVTYAQPGPDPQCVEDIEVKTTSYVRWPESVRQLARAPFAARYLVDLHTITSESLELEISASPLVALPAHALPIEYMEGPALFEGTMGGKPVSGIGIWECSLALYRDWELVDVLATTVSTRPDADSLTPLVGTLSQLIGEGQQQEAIDYVQTDVRPAVGRLSGDTAEIDQILDDLTVVLSAPDA